MLKVLEFRFQTLIFHFQKRVQICDIFKKKFKTNHFIKYKIKKNATRTYKSVLCRGSERNDERKATEGEGRRKVWSENDSERERMLKKFREAVR